ncbi:glycosyltransferase [Hoeflea sp. YIM 152468]|uniref:glycosyltransferase n=1 Tax=Hoeflea sp. YIM 152468 TaxID=3031759 RepID=UPI0023DA559C|nr:glycosyltransferase [Hoeflea sp. YIM 152468]MDF1609648.1 glycosyltransferase [Hoeflea sp. YIM 152468]
MKTAIIVARDNAYGLSQDSGLLMAALESQGFEVETVTPKRGLLARFVPFLSRTRRVDIVFHLERAFPAWFPAGTANLLIPNQERFPERHLARLKRIDLVLAKSRHAEAIFSRLGVPTAFTGFATPDRHLPGVLKNWHRFFHLAGGSTLKGTEEILALWHKNPHWPELVLVQKAANAPTRVPDNVTLVSGYLAEADLRRLQNQCGIHLCPSRSEGWGHYILEAMSCGALVVTTDAPPMNELVTPQTGRLVAWSRTEPRHLGTNFHVDRTALESTIEALLATSGADLAAIGDRARDSALLHQQTFPSRLAAALAAHFGPVTGATP